MTEEEFEKEANKWADDMVWALVDMKREANDDERDFLVQEYKYLQKHFTAELEVQIEKMKCGGNCKHLYHVNTGGCYDAKCDLTYCDCINCKDKWELRR